MERRIIPSSMPRAPRSLSETPEWVVDAGRAGQRLGAAEADGELEHLQGVQDREGGGAAALDDEGEGRPAAGALARDHLPFRRLEVHRAQPGDAVRPPPGGRARRRPRRRWPSPAPCARAGFPASGSASSSCSRRADCRRDCGSGGPRSSSWLRQAPRRRRGRNGRRRIWSGNRRPDRRRGGSASDRGAQGWCCRRSPPAGGPGAPAPPRQGSPSGRDRPPNWSDWPASRRRSPPAAPWPAPPPGRRGTAGLRRGPRPVEPRRLHPPAGQQRIEQWAPCQP